MDLARKNLRRRASVFPSLVFLNLLLLCRHCQLSHALNDTDCPDVDAPVDIAFVVDSSRSIGPLHWQETKQFVQNLISEIEHIHNDTRIAVMQFSESSDIILNYTTINTPEAVDFVRFSIEGMEQDNDLTDLISAINDVHFQLNKQHRGFRNATSLVVFVTDGAISYRLEQNHSMLHSAASSLKATGSIIHVFGVRTAVVNDSALRSVLTALSSSPSDEFVHRLSSVDELWNVVYAVEAVQEILCTNSSAPFNGTQRTITAPTITVPVTCTDLNPSCNALEQEGYCLNATHAYFMTLACPLSCGLCNSLTTVGIDVGSSGSVSRRSSTPSTTSTSVNTTSVDVLYVAAAPGSDSTYLLCLMLLVVFAIPFFRRFRKREKGQIPHEAQSHLHVANRNSVGNSLPVSEDKDGIQLQDMSITKGGEARASAVDIEDLTEIETSLHSVQALEKDAGNAEEISVEPALPASINFSSIDMSPAIHVEDCAMPYLRVEGEDADISEVFEASRVQNVGHASLVSQGHDPIHIAMQYYDSQS